MGKPTYEELEETNRRLANQIVNMTDTLQNSALDIAESGYNRAVDDWVCAQPGAGPIEPAIVTWKANNPYTKIKNEKGLI